MNIAVFCSGRGTNLQAIIDALKAGKIKARIALVISDNATALALERARKAEIKNLFIDPSLFKTKREFEEQIVKYLEEERIGLICLAGFMRVVSPWFVQKFRNKILNIHPVLLPSFKGTEGIKGALEYGVKITGPTVHFVDERVDHGPIILQAAVEVKDDDTEETLAERIHEQEHKIYPEAISLFVEGKLKIEGRKVKILP